MSQHILGREPVVVGIAAPWAGYGGAEPALDNRRAGCYRSR
jgi:hypothetical protein